MEAVEYPVFYDSCPNDSWYTYVHACIHTMSNKPREGKSGSIVRRSARLFVGVEGSVNQQPYGSALVVSSALTPTAAPGSAPEPPEPRIELGIRIFCNVL